MGMLMNNNSEYSSYNSRIGNRCKIFLIFLDAGQNSFRANTNTNSNINPNDLNGRDKINNSLIS